LVSIAENTYQFAGCCRLIRRAIRQSIADAVLTARKGTDDEENEALNWLWDQGRPWADELEDHLTGFDKKHITNLCEEISITAAAARRGEHYHGPLLQRELRRRDKCHLLND
jgi:hypothetical protein